MNSSAAIAPVGETVVIEKPVLGSIIDRLWRDGYTVVGPTLAESAIVIDQVRAIDDLPIGWTDDQEAGTYRLRRRDDRAYFGYAVGPHSWKQFLFPPKTTLYSIEFRADSMTVKPNVDPVPSYAFLGVRSCDLHAIEIQDRVFLHGPYVDRQYQARREKALIVAVHCAVAASTCFCESTGTGPRAVRGFDLALTELESEFLVEIATPRGAAICDGIKSRPAAGSDLGAAARIVDKTRNSMKRSLNLNGLPDILYQNLEHPRWDQVAERCLSCTNCTMVCPTCFCHALEDVPSLDGASSEKIRQWDSCFNPDHAHMAGGNNRPDIRSRYRQWLTHKLASWVDQYGVSGCVGCGRCVTWCPVGIDITEEAAAIRGDQP
jgi:ferredoxin